METTLESVLKSLIEAVESDNGTLFLDGGLVHATIDPLDLGTAYVQACEALGRKPMLAPVQDEPVAPPQRRVRIRHAWGHGNWFDASEAAALRASCATLNARHGAGTHRLEWE